MSRGTFQKKRRQTRLNKSTILPVSSDPHVLETLNVTRNHLDVRQKHSLNINVGRYVLRSRVNICKEARIHKLLLEYPINSNPKDNRNMLSLF